MKRLLILLLSCMWPMTANATEDSIADALTLEQAIIRVLENHPKLKIVDHEAQAMAARLRQALLPPADRVNINLENLAGTGQTSGIRSLEATLSFSRILELGNKAVRRGEVVEHQAALMRTDRATERLDILAETARRFIHVAADQERLQIARLAMDLIRLTETTVEKRIQAGRTPATERSRVAIDMADYELEMDHNRHDLNSSRMRLSVLWNSVQPEFDRVEADLMRLESVPDFEQLTDLLDRNPALLRHVRAADLARARVMLAESRRKPDLNLSAGLRYLGNGDDVAFMLSASLPLGTRGRASHGVAENEALAEIEPLNLEQKRLELHATLFEIYQELHHAKDAVESLSVKIIPAAEKMLDDYERGYQAGRYSLLELIQVQQLLRHARLRAVNMAADFHRYRIEIDRLTGAVFNPW